MVVLRLLSIHTASSCPVPRCYVRSCYVFPTAPIICSLVISPWERSLQWKWQSCFLRDNVCSMGAENAPGRPQGLVSWTSWPWSLWDQSSRKSDNSRETLGLSRCHLRVAQELGSSLAGGLRTFHKTASNTWTSPQPWVLRLLSSHYLQPLPSLASTTIAHSTSTNTKHVARKKYLCP